MPTAWRKTPGKTARLEARVTKEQKALFERAAAIRGRSVTDFVVDSAQRAAVQAIREQEAMLLTARDRKVFVAAMMNPPEPGKRLRKAARRHKRVKTV